MSQARDRLGPGGRGGSTAQGHRQWGLRVRETVKLIQISPLGKILHLRLTLLFETHPHCVWAGPSTNVDRHTE